MATIDVLMRCKDSAKFMPAALKSLKEQTLKDWRFIIVVEKSKDRTMSIARAFEPTRTTVISTAANGMGAAYAAALKESDAKWVAQFDSDDILHPLALEACVRAAESTPDAVGVVTTHQWINESDAMISPLFRPPVDVQDAKARMFRRYELFGFPFFSRAAVDEVGGWNPRMKHAATFDLYHRLLELGRPFAVAKDPVGAEPLLLWRRHDKQVSVLESESLGRAIHKVKKAAWDRRVAAGLNQPHPTNEKPR